jgi:hypothetical protein
MLRPKFSKNQITEKIINLLKERNIPIPVRSIPIPGYSKDLGVTWWYGRGDGLRLSEEGVKLFSSLNIEYYEFPIIFKEKSYSYYGLLIELSKKIMCPYHIFNQSNKPYLRVYDSEIAMMITLFGSVEEYLMSLDKR